MSRSTPSATAWIVPIIVGVVGAMHVWKLPSAVEFIRADTGMSLVESGVLLGVVQVASMIFGVLASLFAERVGMRNFAVLALVLMAIGSVAGAFSSTTGMLITSRAFEGFGFLALTVVGPVLVRRNSPPEKINVSMGWWGSFQGLAVFFAVGISTLLLNATDWVTWQIWWLVMAALTVLLIPVLIIAVPADHASGINWTLASRAIGRSVRSPMPWILGLIFTCYTLQWGTLIGFMPTIFADADLPAGLNTAIVVGLSTAVVGLLNAIGNIWAGQLLNRNIAPRTLVVVALVVGMITMFGIFAPRWEDYGQGANWGIWIQLALAGIFSLVAALIPTTMTRHAANVTPAGGSTSAVLGLMAQIYNSGNFFGPVLFSSLATVLGHWHGSWVITTVLCVIGLVLAIIFLTPERLKLDETA